VDAYHFSDAINRDLTSPENEDRQSDALDELHDVITRKQCKLHTRVLHFRSAGKPVPPPLRAPSQVRIRGGSRCWNKPL
jgi:hypothetical protein